MGNFLYMVFCFTTNKQNENPTNNQNIKIKNTEDASTQTEKISYCSKFCTCCTLSFTSIPILNNCLAISLLLINCIFPGLGTVFLTCCAYKNNSTHFFVGICQFLT